MDRALTCRELVELVTDYLDSALPDAERVRFESHMAACEGCDRYVEQIRITVALTRETRALGERPELTALLGALRDHRRRRSAGRRVTHDQAACSSSAKAGSGR